MDIQNTLSDPTKIKTPETTSKHKSKQKLEFDIEFRPQSFFTDDPVDITLDGFDIVTEEITVTQEERIFYTSNKYEMITDIFQTHPKIDTEPGKDKLKAELTPQGRVKTLHFFFRNKLFMSETRFILAGSFIDGSGADMRRNVFLAVKDTIITAIGSAADLSRNDWVAIDDFSHCTIVPALVDCSVYLSRSPAVDKRLRLSTDKAGFVKKAAMLERHIRYCHAHGVLGVAENDDISDLLGHDLQVMAPGDSIDIRTSGRICRSKQDCADGNPAGGDFLKISYSGNIEACKT